MRISARPGPNFSSRLVSDIAIDDISFENCYAGLVANQSLQCDFDTGSLCSWYQQPNDKDDFDWTLTNNTSPSVGTGPNRDHTTGKGELVFPFIGFTMDRTSKVCFLNLNVKVICTSGLNLKTVVYLELFSPHNLVHRQNIGDSRYCLLYLFTKPNACDINIQQGYAIPEVISQHYFPYY